jgi:polysaccharide export outer membrane protein
MQVVSNRPRLISSSLAVCALLLCGVWSSTGKSEEASRRDVIGPDDTLSILVLDSEEISKSWRVSATGDLNLPLVGKIEAAGMTVEAFQQELIRRLRKYYWEPQVTVYISEFRSEPVTVTGAVEKPGTVQLEGNRTLFEVIMKAGGPKETGDSVTLSRATARGPIAWPGARDDEGQKFSVARLELKTVMEGRSPEANIPVQAYDVITVNQGKQPKLVHIMGAVNKPGAVELVTQERISILRALATAGGPLRGAILSRAQVMHIGPEGIRSEQATVNLKTILAGKAADIELMPGDILVVPSSGIAATVQALAMTAASASVYVLLATI